MKTQTNRKYKFCSQSAKRYALVLYELHMPVEEIQKTKQIFEEIPQLQEVFVNPTVLQEEKFHVIEQVFPEEIRKFLKVVCGYQKMNMLSEIFDAFESYCDEQNGILYAALACTEPPNEEQLKEMEEFLCRKYAVKKAMIEIHIQADLLGGFVLHAGSDEYDWSLRGRLNRLEQKLTWR